MMNDLLVGQRIKASRLRAGISQEALAGKTGLSLRTIQRIEKGETQPRGDSLTRIGVALGVDIEVLLAEDSAGEAAASMIKRDDRGYLAILNLSPLAFILFPGLGIVAPLLFWGMRREEIAGVNEVGRQILNFQITWLLLLVIFICFIFWQGGDFLPFLYLATLILFYGFNLFLTIINSIRTSKGRRPVYPLTIPFIRA